MCIDFKILYLETPLYWYEYMRTKQTCIPKHFIDIYNIHEKVKNKYFYQEIQRGIYVLHQAGIFYNKKLKDRMRK